MSVFCNSETAPIPHGVVVINMWTVICTIRSSSDQYPFSALIENTHKSLVEHHSNQGKTDEYVIINMSYRFITLNQTPYKCLIACCIAPYAQLHTGYSSQIALLRLTHSTVHNSSKHRKPRKPQASRPLFYKLQASEVSHLIFHG